MAAGALAAVPLIWMRFGRGYAAVVLLGLLLPLSSGHYEGLGRYCSVLFPLAIMLGSLKGEARHFGLLTGFVLFYALVGLLGVLAVPVGFLISNVMLAPVSWWYARTAEQFSPRGRTLRLLWTSILMGALWVAAPLRLPFGAAEAVLAAGFVLWMGLNVNKSDVSRVRDIFVKRARRRGERRSDSKPDRERDAEQIDYDGF